MGAALTGYCLHCGQSIWNESVCPCCGSSRIQRANEDMPDEQKEARLMARSLPPTPEQEDEEKWT